MKPGDEVGRYRLVGAALLSGPIWLARGPDGAVVQLETYPEGDPSFASEARFAEDLAVARGLRHANLLRVVDAGITRGLNYVVTEFAEGLRLPALVEGLRQAGRVVPAWSVAYILHGLARAVHRVQTCEGPGGQPLGSLGRPVHPGAVVLTRTGGVKLALLPTLDRRPHRTWNEPFSGYRSPEVVAGVSLDGRSDLFGLGVLAWELLTDRPLFGRLTEPERSEAILEVDAPALPATVPKVLVEATRACLARRPDDRPRDGAAVAELLGDALQRHAEASAEETRRLVALAHAFVPPGRAETAPLDATALGDTQVSSPPRPPRRRAATPETPAAAAGDAFGPPERRAATIETPAAAAGDAFWPPERRAATIETPAAATGPADEDPFFDPLRDLAGAHDGRFEVLGRLGTGGMGEVYRVLDRELDEIVALKMLARSGPGEAESLERLRREVRLARRIASDNVCRIYDIVDLEGGGRGLTMAVVEGTTLCELTKAGLPRDYERFSRWGADIASGLAAAHKLSIVHRDLKPENVMVRHGDDRAVILDFGIARRDSAATDPDGRLTESGIIMGTPPYMSPEQLCNGPLDGRSDLYALGLILAEIITGEVPRMAENYAGLLQVRALEPKPYDIRAVEPGVPSPLADVINQLLQSAAADRPASAELVQAALTAPEASANATLPTLLELEGPALPVGRRRMARAGAIVLAAAALAIGGVAVGGRSMRPGSTAIGPAPAASGATETLTPPAVGAAGAVDAADAVDITAPARSPPPSAKAVLVRVISVPAGALVVDEEEVLGRAPIDVDVSRGSRRITLRLRGYETESRVLTASDVGGVRVRLEARRTKRRDFPPLAPR